MRIAGLQKLTLLDYPNHIACTIFLQGCNLKCPFCYNSPLIEYDKEECISEVDFFSFLEARKGILEGVAISGGEPLLNKDIFDLIRKIRSLGYLVKLDTNGTFPDKLKYLLDNNLVDYVAMDIKNSLDKYPQTTNSNIIKDDIIKSINLLINSQIEYEFRTTVVKEYHSFDDFVKIGKMIQGAKHYYLQSFEDKSSVLQKDLHPMSKEELNECIQLVFPFVSEAKVRGID